MRILIASDLHWPTINGIATFGRNLAQGLAAAGHEVVVVAPSQTGKKYEETDVNHRVIRTASVIFPFYQNLRICLSPGSEIKQIVQEFQPDVIHLQTPLGIGMGAVQVAKKYHIPLVATNHSMSENLLDNLKMLAPFAKQLDYILRESVARLLNNADYVTLPTQTAINMMKTDSFKKPHVAISNGIDLSRFKPGRPVREFRDKFGIPHKVPIILYVGRLDAEKHAHILIKAAHQLMNTHEFHLVVVGFGNDLDRLEDLAEDLDMQHRVTFTGRIDEADKPDFFRAASIFAMPSPAELQSIAMLEAMASGLPVVAVNAGALYELCHEGNNGYLYELDDSDGMAQALARLLDNPDVAADFGKCSLEIAKTHDLKQTIKAFEKLYAEVIATYETDQGKN